MTDFSTKFVLQSLDGGIASFNVVTPERGSEAPAIVYAYCTLTILDDDLLGSLTVGDTFEVAFSPPAPEKPKKGAKPVVEEPVVDTSVDTAVDTSVDTAVDTSVDTAVDTSVAGTTEEGTQ